MLDIVFRDEQPQKAVPGGSTFNAMISLGRYGLDCAMVTEVGDDHVGELTRRYLSENHVDTRFVRTRKGMKSHISLAFLDEQHDAHYTFYKDHNAWTIDLEGTDIRFTKEDVLLLGSYYAINPVTRPLVSMLLQRAHEAGAFIYYDINFRRPHVADLPMVKANIEENIRLASVVRASDEDIAMIGFMPEHEHLIITRGAKEVTYHGQHYPTPQIEAVSTIGAGDNFNAGFIAGHIQRLSETDQIALAQKFAQNVCKQYENSIELPL